MATTVYNQGLDELRNFTSVSFKALLLKGAGYVVNRDHDFVAALTPAANEVAGAGYARQSLATKTRVIDDALDRITYDCVDLDFGSIAVGETVTGVVVFRFVTNDADSVLIGYYPIGSVPTNGNPFLVSIDPTGLLYTVQGS